MVVIVLYVMIYFYFFCSDDIGKRYPSIKSIIDKNIKGNRRLFNSDIIAMFVVLILRDSVCVFSVDLTVTVWEI